MKKYLTIAAGLIASTALMMAASPALAHVDVDVNIGLPGVVVAPEPVYVQPRPVYVEPRPVYIPEEREHDWRERHLRARQWQEQQWHERHDEHRGHDNGEHRGHDNGEHRGHDE